MPDPTCADSDPPPPLSRVRALGSYVTLVYTPMGKGTHQHLKKTWSFTLRPSDNPLLCHQLYTGVKTNVCFKNCNKEILLKVCLQPGISQPYKQPLDSLTD